MASEDVDVKLEDHIPADGVLSPDDWKSRWAGGGIVFHNEYINPNLIAYFEQLTAGRSSLRIFVPLCGKTFDLKWMYDEGHTVVGVEVVREAVQQFFIEQNIPFEIMYVNQVECFQTKDERLKIYVTDIFSFNWSIESLFDGCWDKAAMSAINKPDRMRYVDLIFSLMKSTCRILLSTLDYDTALFPGPPHPLPDYQLHDLYERQHNCSILLLHCRYAYDERKYSYVTNKAIYEKIHLITSKQ